jgi:prepilin-type N-terminal cleavage/methylation domain-containing protein
MRRNYTAFTLLELVVVMAIMAVMAGIGIQGLIIFRQTIQFQQTETDVITIMNTVRNRARNSVASDDLVAGSIALPDAVVDGYAIGFAANNYSLRRCSMTVVFGDRQVSCINVEDSDMKPTTLDPVNVFMLDSTKCRALFYERLTGDISALANLTSNTDDIGVCTIRVQHSNNPALVRDIVIDLVNNNSDAF